MRDEWIVLGALLLAAPAAPAVGEVKVAATDHFQVEAVQQTTAGPERLYQALVGEVGRWWHPDHTFSGSAANLSIDPVPGGCFCERFPEGGGARHLTVVYAKPGAVLRLSGGLGPLQSGALSGTLTFTLKPSDGGSAIEATYVVSGFHTPALDHWAPAVDGVLAVRVQRLARYLDTGSPEPPADGGGDRPR